MSPDNRHVSVRAESHQRSYQRQLPLPPLPRPLPQAPLGCLPVPPNGGVSPVPQGWTRRPTARGTGPRRGFMSEQCGEDGLAPRRRPIPPLPHAGGGELLRRRIGSSDRQGKGRAPAPVLGHPTMLLLGCAGEVGWPSHPRVCFPAPFLGWGPDLGTCDHGTVQGRSMSSGRWSCVPVRRPPSGALPRHGTAVGRAGAGACARRLHRTI